MLNNSGKKNAIRIYIHLNGLVYKDATKDYPGHAENEISIVNNYEQDELYIKTILNNFDYRMFVKTYDSKNFDMNLLHNAIYYDNNRHYAHGYMEMKKTIGQMLFIAKNNITPQTTLQKHVCIRAIMKKKTRAMSNEANLIQLYDLAIELISVLYEMAGKKKPIISSDYDIKINEQFIKPPKIISSPIQTQESLVKNIPLLVSVKNTSSIKSRKTPIEPNTEKEHKTRRTPPPKTNRFEKTFRKILRYLKK